MPLTDVPGKARALYEARRNRAMWWKRAMAT